MPKVSKSGPKPKIHRVKCAMCHGFNLRTASEVAERKGCGHCGYRRPRKYIRWTHTRKALAEYDRLRNDREKAFDMAMSTEAVNAAFMKRAIYIGEYKGILNYGMTGYARRFRRTKAIWAFRPDGHDGFSRMVITSELYFTEY